MKFLSFLSLLVIVNAISIDKKNSDSELVATNGEADEDEACEVDYLSCMKKTKWPSAAKEETQKPLAAVQSNNEDAKDPKLSKNYEKKEISMGLTL